MKPLSLAVSLALSALAMPAFAQQEATTRQLVNQGSYWQDQGREDLAAETWRKLLAVDPQQPDALLGLGMIELNQGRRAGAESRLQQLQASHPGAPQTTRLRMALSGGGELQAARRAAAAGRYAEAVRAYDEVFGAGGPPAGLALEYYQVLAGTQEGWTRARDGLRSLATADNPAARLALGQMLTYREPSRREGIALLQALAGDATHGGSARAAWRQALLWLEARSTDAPLYDAFLEMQPGDREVAAARLQLREQAAARAAARDPVGEALGRGFTALDRGDLATAEARFVEVLRARARDPEALGGLGSVRLRQERFAEAHELLRPAAAADRKWRDAANAARYWLTLADVARQPGADAIGRVREMIALQPREPAGYVAMGDLTGASDPVAAEENYRHALELDPANAGALQGLVALLGRLGRAAEAVALFDRLSPEQQQAAGGPGVLRANIARSRAQQALADGNPDMARIELEDALLAQPGDPWLRLELARLYRQAGRPDQARGVMDALADTGADSAQSLFARALFARELGEWAQVQVLLEQVPAGSRDAEMTTLLDTAWVHGQAAQARALVQARRDGEAQMLLARVESALGERASDPAVIATLAGAYADIGSGQRAMVLAERLLEGSPGVEQRLQYASVLLQAGRDSEVAAMLRQLEDAPVTAAQRADLDALRSGYVLRQVDALRELGNLEGAYEVLAPELARQPDEPGNIAALARLYASAGDHGQALALYRQQLQLAPDDVDGLTAAAASAGAMRDLDLAGQYLEQALALAPESPDVLAAAGRVYRDAGKRRRAESYFKAALAASSRGSGLPDHGYPAARGAPGALASSNPFAGLTPGAARGGALRDGGRPLPLSVAALAGESSYRPAGPAPSAAAAAPVPATGLPAPVRRDQGLASLPPARGSYGAAASPSVLPPASTGNPVLDELRALRAENGSTLAVGAAYRSRAGEEGLGQLDDLQVPMEGRFAVGDGTLAVTITPTVLDAGRPEAEYPAASRFGGGPQAALAAALAADSAPVDGLVGSSLYRTLLTRGDIQATRNLLHDRALDSGRFQELYNQTDGALTPAERQAATLELLFADPLPAYVLSQDLANMTIGSIARQVLGNAGLARGLEGDERAQLEALSRSNGADQTPLEFQDTLYAMAGSAAGERRIGAQDASGVGVSVAWEQGGLRADIGSTPLGFDQSQVVGGLRYSGEAGDHLTWSAEASRRAVTDSLLSFAGVEDARSGLAWGGVAASGARVAATLDNGQLGGYASLSWHRLEGENVADNERAEVGVGVYVHALETEQQSLTAGLHLTAMQYDRNLSGFTWGHGGYFSPQRYIDVGFPVHWTGLATGGRVAWQLDASVGVQHFRGDPSPFFPTDLAMQQAAYDAASLASLLGLVSEYAEPMYEGQTKTGVSYNFSGAAEWQLSPQLFLGGRLEFNNARDYRQFGTNLYLRFLLDRMGTRLGRQPQPLRSPFAGGE